MDPDRARSVLIVAMVAIPVAFLAFGLLSSPQVFHLLTRAVDSLAQLWR
jgi:hypothetical protein